MKFITKDQGTPLVHASLFTGIGGFDEAAKELGWTQLFHCEIDPFGQSVVQPHFPNSIPFYDITKTDFTPFKGHIDVLSGGFPCQPYSQAGIRKGKKDSRHLWPEYLRAIRETQTPWVVAENVSGLVDWSGGLVFEEVCSNLENEGFEVWPFILPAASINAPHKRDRVFFIAYSASNRRFRDWTSIKIEAGQGSEYSGIMEEGPKRLRIFGTSPVSGGEHFEINANRRFTEKFLSFKNWENFPTESPVCSGNDGICPESLRQRIRIDSLGVISEEEIDEIFFQAYRKFQAASLKAYGNAVVVDLIVQIFYAVQLYHNQTES